jgi:hypothetical protein
MQIPVCALMRVLDADLEAGNRPGNGLSLYCLTRFHAIDRAISCSLICNRNLACGEDTRLDCCDVISIIGDFHMTIIMLSRLYFMLSCQLTPINAPPVHHGRRVDTEATCILIGPHLSPGVGSEALWAKLLLGFWCEDTYHLGSPDLSSNRDRTCS